MMAKQPVSIRLTTPADSDAVRALHMSAFGAEESADVADLAVAFMHDETVPPTFSWLAEINGQLAGHVVFSPARSDHNPDWCGYILAPLAASPDFQKRGVGSALVEHGLAQLKAMQDPAVSAVFVYGDPDYYGRFGFSVDAAKPYQAPYPLEYPHGWHALVIREPDAAKLPSSVRLTCTKPLQNPALW